jgi:hypothetical protein
MDRRLGPGRIFLISASFFPMSNGNEILYIDIAGFAPLPC